MREGIRLSLLVIALLLGNGSTGLGYEVITVTDGGTLTGVVQFRGTRPPQAVLEISKDQSVCGKTEKRGESLLIGEDFGVQNAVVILTNIVRGKEFVTKSVTLDQRECRYVPHVLLVPAGGEVSFLNNDGILHNLHTQSTTNTPINKAQPKFKKILKEAFQFPEIIKLNCDAHAWMTGWLVVTEHPYYVVTDGRGYYQLDNIPPGEYTGKVWHESFGEQKQTVKISPRTVTVQNFELR